jgi:DsbC/DsbD-like thiol-disulfide interchange protein
VKSVDVRFPAPSRSEDAAGVSYVYHEAVLLPVLVEPEDPTKPVHIALSVEYGICKDICIPARAELTRDLGTPPSSQADIDAVLRTKVPRKQEIGAGGELTIRAIEAGSPDTKGFTALVSAPAGTSPQLFVEAPEGWYFSTSPPDARNQIAVTLDEKPAGAESPVAVTLTLVAGEKSVESTVGLDGNGKPR